ncbi:MAG: hypothetical protein DMG32_03900 [Acidobacteria bacterium]|nr:MAG: hypothetical protein DMG32_03900 [Acidobacteriota bacterium]
MFRTLRPETLVIGSDPQLRRFRRFAEARCAPVHSCSGPASGGVAERLKAAVLKTEIADSLSDTKSN